MLTESDAQCDGGRLRGFPEPVVEPDFGEVRVRIEAFAVNPLDAMRRSGASPGPVPLPHARLGIEGAGVIDAIGPEVVGLEVGDPVIITAIPDSAVRGSYADHTTIPAAWVIPRPAELDLEHAAAIWVAYSTAYGALVEAATMRPNDRVLIAGASGAVGRAAIQIATQIGALPIAVTRDTAKTDDLLQTGAVRVIVADEVDMVDVVHRETDGAGADIVLDLVRGPGQQNLLRATRSSGVLVAAGYLDHRPTPEAGATPVAVINYRGYDKLLDPIVVQRMTAFLNAGVSLGTLRPAIDTVFGFGDVVEAHRRFESRRHCGRKILIRTETS